jgi:hypothetical protein
MVETGARLYALFDKGRLKVAGSADAVQAALAHVDRLLVRRRVPRSPLRLGGQAAVTKAQGPRVGERWDRVHRARGGE